MKKLLFLVVLFIATASSCNKNNGPADINKPFIVLLGDNPAYSELGKPYSDAGANAFDITASGDTINITSSITVTNNIDINTAGKYQVSYNVSDESGNKADEKTRTVYVQIF